MDKYIKLSHKRVMTERREYTLFGHINVFVKDALPANIDMTEVLMNIERDIPANFLYEVDTILVGQFDDLNVRGVKAAYMDGAIYVTNDQSNNDDILDDIVHEIAHAVEKMYGMDLYGDGAMEQEFLGKKKRFLDILRAYGYNIPTEESYSSEYSKEFDEFVFYELGYEKAGNMVMGLFITPYASASISEYFATGFEAYFMRKEKNYLMNISPVLYKKLNELTNYSKENY
tara:strand:+ start:504 stop:1193 length:690 start_codon:yes stop_codon:yes gene_type:complete